MGRKKGSTAGTTAPIVNKVRSAAAKLAWATAKSNGEARVIVAQAFRRKAGRIMPEATFFTREEADAFELANEKTHLVVYNTVENATGRKR